VRYALDRVVRIPGSGARFTAMPGVRRYATSSAWFLAERDADRRAFNERFGRSLLTEADTRRTLGRLKADVPPGYRDYAPIDFGGGLTIGQVASTDSGTGRWDFFNGAIVGPIVAGKRVLDLGSNNGSMPLMMLRAGASEVVAIERTPQIAEFARFNARVLGWRDMRPYAMEVLDGDMRLFLTSDLGRFDVVTAFCSLYYLPEADMARVIAKAAAMGATLVLQANEAIDNLPARAAILERLMVANGYPNVRVHAPSGFARPLLVATAPTAVASGDPAFAARA
jgi:SAM-dependent methyltransferase